MDIFSHFHFCHSRKNSFSSLSGHKLDRNSFRGQGLYFGLYFVDRGKRNVAIFWLLRLASYKNFDYYKDRLQLVIINIPSARTQLLFWEAYNIYFLMC